MDLKSTIRVIEGYPIEGVSFKDITTLLKDKEAFNYSLDLLEEALEGLEFDYIVGIESRGFIFGAPLADRLNKGFVPVRKPGKLPGEIEKISYDLEYGNNELEMHKDAIGKGDRVIIEGSSSEVSKLTATVYIVPVAMMLVGALIPNIFLKNTTMDINLLTLLSVVIFFAISMIFIKKLDKNVKNKNMMRVRKA